MISKCKQCGGKIFFSAKEKGNVCERCGAVYPIEYNLRFEKKSFDEYRDVNINELSGELKSVRCKSCGATLVLSNLELKKDCPYCGSSSVIEGEQKVVASFDSIIPFSFGKAEALMKLSNAVSKNFFAEKKVTKNLTKDDVHGAYINSFVFDFDTVSSYNGVFSYTEYETDKEGRTHSYTRTKNVSGIFAKKYSNITVEANSNLEQRELLSIMPFNYNGAVDFKTDFMSGYMLEMQDKMFADCVKLAEKIIRKDIKQELLRKHNCEAIEQLNLDLNFKDRKYNYCLLPVYFVKAKNKEKNYKILINGQTGKVGKLPKNILRIILFLIFIGCIVTAGILLGVFLS